MKPRSLTPEWRTPRSSSRSTTCRKVACESEKARWCTVPGSRESRSGSADRSSFVKTVIRRPSPGSKYRWLSASLSRFGCSNTNGIPSRPSQKSIAVCRPAPTMVMWCTPWLWIFRIGLPRSPSRSVGNPDSDRERPVTYGVAVILLVAATDRELCSHDGLVCGVGPVEAAAATARTLALHRFDVGSEAVYRDLSAEWPVVDRVTPDPGLVERVRSALPDAAATPIHTSAAVGASSDTMSRGPLVEAMEGFGVLRAAERAGVPAVEVRVVSNEIGEEDRSRWQLGVALDALEDALPRIVRTLVDADARWPASSSPACPGWGSPP